MAATLGIKLRSPTQCSKSSAVHIGRSKGDIAQGWHLSASSGSTDANGSLAVEGITDVVYPVPTSLITEFQAAPMEVYSGHVTLVVKQPVSVVELQLQLCSDSVCLSPQRATLRLSAD